VDNNEHIRTMFFTPTIERLGTAGFEDVEEGKTQ
jgi:hypothetical protein